MKNKKKGFTLIELLAIIVILAIIAVITVPLILGIIDDSKEKASIDSAYGFKDAVQNYYMNGLLGNQTQELPSGYVLVGLLPNDFAVSGEDPTEDSWIQLEKGHVVSYSLKFGDYTVTKYKDTDVVCEKGNVQENEETRAERLKLEAKAQAATEVQTYINSLLANTTIQGYTKDTGKKVSEISTPTAPTGVDTNSWIYFKKETSSVTAPDYSIKITIDDYTFVVSSVDGTVSDPVYNGELLAQKKPASFADDSWADIKVNLTANRNTYNIGDTKEVVIDGTSYTVRLSNKSSCPAGWTGSETACGVVIEFVDTIIDTGNNNTDGHVMNTTNTNAGGWPASEMYSYLNTTIFNKLPAELKVDGMILNTKSISGHGSKSGATNYISTNDKLYLLSYVEVWGTNYDYDSLKLQNETVTDGTRQLEYYGTSSSTRVKTTTSGTSKVWWSRSATSSSTASFLYVSSDDIYSGIAYATNGVAPAFRILD